MTEPPAGGLPELARGTRGAVVAPHHLATAAGLRILQAGGSAVDAAIATNAVLGVVMPGACGLGGDAFWLVWDAGAQEQVALNGAGRAGRRLRAARADAEALRGRGLRGLPDRGALTITVPGAVRSWSVAHARWGRLDRSAVLAPAIEIALDGFAASAEYVEDVEAAAELMPEDVGAEAAKAFAGVFRPDGQAVRRGAVIRRPALAATLETLVREGFDAFYAGDLAGRIVSALRAAGSPLDRTDFEAQDATWGSPIRTTYRGVHVTAHPPTSSGVVALEILRVLERFEPPPQGAFGPGGVTDARWIHLVIEVAKLAMADRDAFLGDGPGAWSAEAMLDDDRIAALATSIDPLRASSPPGTTAPPAGGTVFLGVVDEMGNAVSLIQSVFSNFGSGIVDAGTGIVFHNRGTYFSLQPGHPNELAPGRRPLHTLLPGMLFRDGQTAPWIVVGSMGADAQPQIHAQFVSAVVDGGRDIATAVAAPRWFVAPAARFQPPVEVRVEPRFDPGVLAALEARGHPLLRAEPWDAGLGQQHAIELVDGGPGRPGGSLAATTDPRSDGQPAMQ